MFLPPWSPMLNPIELVFADYKRIVRTEITVTRAAEVLAIVNMPHGEKCRRRNEILGEISVAACGDLCLEVIAAHCDSVLQPLAQWLLV